MSEGKRENQDALQHEAFCGLLGPWRDSAVDDGIDSQGSRTPTLLYSGFFVPTKPFVYKQKSSGPLLRSNQSQEEMN
jgi:hypothetical protein